MPPARSRLARGRIRDARAVRKLEQYMNMFSGVKRLIAALGSPVRQRSITIQQVALVAE
jgi:hypothetical protein